LNWLQLWVCIAFIALHCKNSSSESQVSSDSSQTSLDWPGIYTGLLPCDSCPGVTTELTLNNNLTFMLKSNEVGKEDQVEVRSGVFTWDHTGSRITLSNLDKGPSEYLVGEDVLSPVDKTYSQGGKYKLIRTTESILGYYRWKITELMGKYIDNKVTAYIRFDTDARLLNGFAWCANFSGTYEYLGNHQIKFGKMTPNPQVCPDSTAEHQFLNMFVAADHFSIDGHVLTFTHGEQSSALAKFEAIKMR